MPSRVQKVDGKPKEWTPAEHAWLQVAVGDRARQVLAALVRLEDCRKADDDGRQSKVSDLVRDAHQAARKQVEGSARRATGSSSLAGSSGRLLDSAKAYPLSAD